MSPDIYCSTGNRCRDLKDIIRIWTCKGRHLQKNEKISGQRSAGYRQTSHLEENVTRSDVTRRSVDWYRLRHTPLVTYATAATGSYELAYPACQICVRGGAHTVRHAPCRPSHRGLSHHHGYNSGKHPPKCHVVVLGRNFRAQGAARNWPTGAGRCHSPDRVPFRTARYTVRPEDIISWGCGP